VFEVATVYVVGAVVVVFLTTVGTGLNVEAGCVASGVFTSATVSVFETSCLWCRGYNPMHMHLLLRR
jgi:hypothetical protein